MSDLFARLSRVYAQAARNGKPVVGFATPRVWDEYEAELRMRGTRDDDNPHKYLFSSADALARDFPNLLFMGIPLCRDSDMAAGVRFEVRGYEPYQVVSSAAAPARLGYREVGSPGAGETRPTQLAPADGPRVDGERPVVKHTRERFEPRAGHKDIWRYLLDTGRMKVDDQFPVAVCRSHASDVIGLWFKRERGIITFESVSGLEVVQNKLDLQQLWGFPDAHELGYMWGYDILPVGPSGPFHPPPFLPVPSLLPKSASKQLSGIDLSEARYQLPTAPAELQAHINDAEQKRTHLKQLRMLVNERVPSHLMGADIVKVETTFNQLYIDVSVAGAQEPIRIPSARLWDANLTVQGCVELHGGEILAAPPAIPHPMLP